MDKLANIDCDCGYEIPVTLEMLESDTPATCPKCGARINFDTTDLNSAIDSGLNSFMTDLTKKFK